MKDPSKKENRRVIVVMWKLLDNRPCEIYSSLKVFCDKNPHFAYNTLCNYISKKRIAFENEQVRIERKEILTNQNFEMQPDLPRRLFWEYKFEEMDWIQDIAIVIERVLEKGTLQEWNEVIRFYGFKKVRFTIKNKIGFLPDHKMEETCIFFSLKKEELKCYIRKQSRAQHWI